MRWTVPDNLKVVIFDLDNTLHNTDVSPKALGIVKFFYQNGVKVALASLNQIADVYLYEYKLIDFFDHIEIRDMDEYYLSKRKMFKAIIKHYKNKKIEPENMLLFDDCIVHCIDAENLGMKAIRVDHHKLITWRDVNEGLFKFKLSLERRHSI